MDSWKEIIEDCFYSDSNRSNEGRIARHGLFDSKAGTALLKTRNASMLAGGKVHVNFVFSRYASNLPYRDFTGIFGITSCLQLLEGGAGRSVCRPCVGIAMSGGLAGRAWRRGSGFTRGVGSR